LNVADNRCVSRLRKSRTTTTTKRTIGGDEDDWGNQDEEDWGKLLISR
jgi:hypothetical protein